MSTITNEHLVEIINSVLSADSTLLPLGQAKLSQLQASDINQYVQCMLQIMKEHPTHTVRAFCSENLKTVLCAEDQIQSKWVTLSEETQKLVKSQLLETLNAEQEYSCREKLCTLIGELVSVMTSIEYEPDVSQEGKQWNEIHQYIFGLVKSGDNTQIENGLMIWGKVFTFCAHVYKQFSGQVHEILKSCMEHEDLKIKTKAALCFAEYISAADWKDCKAFLDLVPLLLTNVTAVCEDNATDGVEIIDALINLIEIEPKIIRPNFMNAYEMLKNIAQSESDVAIDQKQIALEGIVVLIEHSLVLAKKQVGFLEGFIQVLFSYMISTVEEVSDKWSSPTADDLTAEEDPKSSETAIKFCMTLFDRIITALGEEKAISPLASVIQKMLATNEWKQKYAALMALSQTAEHIEEVSELDMPLQAVLNCLKDEHPKVQYAALHCIGQFADDMQPEFQERHYDSVIPALLQAFKSPIKRVLSHALAAFSNYAEGAPEKLLKSQLEEVVDPCLELLKNGTSMLKENALAAISSIAENTKDDFLPYWERTAEIVFPIMENMEDKSKTAKQLRGQSIECFRVMGDAVGKEEFIKVVPQLVKAMIKIQEDDLEEVDPQRTYLFQGYHSICYTLQKDFGPYLSQVLPSLFPILAKVASKPDDEEAQGSVVATMLSSFLYQTGEACLPYLETMISLLTQILQNSKNHEVMTSVVQTYPEVIKVLKASASSSAIVVTAYTGNFLTAIWNIFSNEFDPSFMRTLVLAMKKIVQESGRVLSAPAIGVMMENISNGLRESDTRREEFLQMKDDEDCDEDEVDVLQEEELAEADLQCSLGELVAMIINYYQELVFVQAKEIVLKSVPKATDPAANKRMRVFVLMMINPFLRCFGSQLAKEELELLVQVLFKLHDNANLDVRSYSCYGIGILAEVLGSDFEKIAEMSAKALNKAFYLPHNQKHFKEKLYWKLTLRIMAAIGKLLKFQSHVVDTDLLPKKAPSNFPDLGQEEFFEFCKKKNKKVVESSDREYIEETRQFLAGLEVED